jgi:hypothetical protein
MLEANVLAIRHLADRVAQHVFADLGTSVLDCMVKSFIGGDDELLQRGPVHPVAKTFARIKQRYAEKTAKFIDLEDRPSSVH